MGCDPLGKTDGDWRMYKQAAYNLAIGMTLRQLHEEQKLQRDKIAETLEISELGVSRIEHGSELLTAGGLVLLLNMFDISWDDFMARVKANLPEAQSRIT
jgi:transcriptional regulator with XRE-family HTH domain